VYERQHPISGAALAVDACEMVDLMRSDIKRLTDVFIKYRNPTGQAQSAKSQNPPKPSNIPSTSNLAHRKERMSGIETLLEGLVNTPGRSLMKRGVYSVARSITDLNVACLAII